MEFGEKIFFALLQSLTEFLPVSSSAHLFLLQRFLQKEFNGEVEFFLVFLQGLSLLSVPFLFRRFFALYFQKQSWFLFKRWNGVFFALSFGSLPFLLVGYCLRGAMSHLFHLGNLKLGLLLGTFVLFFDFQKKVSETNVFLIPFWKIWCVACVQCFAFFPGVSRLGVTFGFGRILGFSRKTALKVSYLLGFPGLLSASFYQLLGKNKGLLWRDLTFLFLVPFLAYGFGKFFLRFMEKWGMGFFILYRLFLCFLLFWGESLF